MQAYEWPSREATERLNILLGLPATGREQDWEVEFADSNRLDPWLELFRSGALEIEERGALALLILFSLIYPDGEIQPGQVEAVRNTIAADPAVSERMASYWSTTARDRGGMIDRVLGDLP